MWGRTHGVYPPERVTVRDAVAALRPNGYASGRRAVQSVLTESVRLYEGIDTFWESTEAFEA